jgi:hypothetical protein
MRAGSFLPRTFWSRRRSAGISSRRSQAPRRRLHRASTIAAWLACKPLCCVRKSRRHTAPTGGRRLPILPDCNRSAVSCSPLEGDCRPPRRRTANRTRKGPVFFSALRSGGVYAPFRLLAEVLARRPLPLPLLLFRNAREDDQWRGPPRPSLRSASASRSTGICRPNSDPGPLASVLNGATHRPRARLGGGRRLSSMELSLPDMPFGMGGRRARAAAHPGESRRHRRR